MLTFTYSATSTMLPPVVRRCMRPSLTGGATPDNRVPGLCGQPPAPYTRSVPHPLSPRPGAVVVPLGGAQMRLPVLSALVDAVLAEPTLAEVLADARGGAVAT